MLPQGSATHSDLVIPHSSDSSLPSIRAAGHHRFGSLTALYGRNFNLKPKDFLFYPKRQPLRHLSLASDCPGQQHKQEDLCSHAVPCSRLSMGLSPPKAVPRLQKATAGTLLPAPLQSQGRARTFWSGTLAKFHLRHEMDVWTVPQD